MRKAFLRHPLLVFGILLVGPAAGLTWVAFGSVRAEGRLRASEAETEARLGADRAVDAEADVLETIRRREVSLLPSNRSPYGFLQFMLKS